MDVPAGRATQLLQLLALHPGRLVSSDRIVEALWAEPQPSAYQGVASLVSRLRRAIGPDSIEGDRRGYRLTSAVVTDLAAIESLLARASAELRAGSPARAASPVQRVLALLDRGELIEGSPDVPWADSTRRLLDRARREARELGWVAAAQLGDHTLAAELAEAAVAIDELDEAAAVAAMAAWNALGQPGRADAVYRRLAGALADELGAEPGDAARAERQRGARRMGMAPKAAEPAPGGPPVGRASHWAVLTGEWSTAQRGCRLAVVVGAPGAGKSHLVDLLCREITCRGGLVLRAAARGAERSVFLHPLAEVLADHLRSLDRENRAALTTGWEGPLHDLLPNLVEEPAAYQRLSSELEHRQVLEAVGSVLGRIAAEHPTVLVIENLHHTAASALEAVELTRSRLEETPLLMVATLRAEPDVDVSELLGNVDAVVKVGPFDLEATTDLAGAAGLPDLAGAIHDATGGDPFFVIEALRLAQDAGPEAALQALAGSVREVVLERIRRCGPDVDGFLRLAATFGLIFDLDDVAALGDQPPETVADQAAQALGAGLITVRQDHFAFASSVVRDVLYTSTPSPIRVSRHRRAAIGAATPEARARHFDAAAEHAGAADAWMEAAEMARRRVANRDADRLVSSAIASSERSGNERRTVELLIFRAGVRVDRCRYPDARDDLDAARLRARAIGADELETRALAGLGWTAYYARDAEAASDYAERVTLLAENAASSPAALPSALVLLGRVRHWAGDIDGAAAAYQQALDRDPDKATEASALSCLGALLEHGDRYGEAVGVLGRAITAAEDTQSSRSLLRALFFSGLARANAGDLAGALRMLERKRSILERYDLRFYRARTATALSWVWRELGDLGRAEELAAQALEESLTVDAGALQTEQELHAHQALAECALGRGDHAAAEASLDRAALAFEVWLPFRWRAELRQVELETRLDLGRTEELLELSRRRGSWKYEALALARLGRQDLAAPVAARTGSTLLLAQVGPAVQAKRAAEAVAGQLPGDLRERFVRRGPAADVLRS